MFEGLLSFDMNEKLIHFVAHDADTDSAREGEGEAQVGIPDLAMKLLEDAKQGAEVEDRSRSRSRSRSGGSTEYREQGGSGERESEATPVGADGSLNRFTAEAPGARAAAGGGEGRGVEWLQLYSMVLSSALSTGEVQHRTTEQCSM